MELRFWSPSFTPERWVPVTKIHLLETKGQCFDLDIKDEVNDEIYRKNGERCKMEETRQTTASTARKAKAYARPRQARARRGPQEG